MRNKTYYPNDMLDIVEYVKENPSDKSPEEIYNDWTIHTNNKLTEHERGTLGDIKIFREKLKGDSELVLFWDGRQSSRVFELAQNKYFNDTKYWDFNQNSFIHAFRMDISNINSLWSPYKDDKYFQFYKHTFDNGNEMILLFGSLSPEDDSYKYDKYTLSDVIREEGISKYMTFIESSLSNPWLMVLFKDNPEYGFEYENGIEVIEKRFSKK